MENNDFEGDFDARISGFLMFFFGLPFACVPFVMAWLCYCLLYTSDAADE